MPIFDMILSRPALDRIQIALTHLAQRELAEQPARMAVGDAFLRQIGIHGRGADADQHGEIMRIEAFGRHAH